MIKLNLLESLKRNNLLCWDMRCKITSMGNVFMYFKK